MNRSQIIPYIRHDHNSFLDGFPLSKFSQKRDERRYILAVRDLPEDEKPREKLLRNGPAYLSLAELLAVVLNTGTKKEELLSMTHRILKEYGQKSIIVQKDANKLARDLNIPTGKALQIVAVTELGRRFFEKNENATPTIRTANDAFEYVTDMLNLKREHLRGLYLNTHYKLIHDEIISIGTVDASIVHPREVFKPAIEYGAAAVILVHNHPSGVVNPSQSDRDMTKQLIKAGELIGIDLIDHIIVAKNKFTSIPAPYKE